MHVSVTQDVGNDMPFLVHDGLVFVHQSCLHCIGDRRMAQCLVLESTSLPRDQYLTVPRMVGADNLLIDFHDGDGAGRARSIFQNGMVGVFDTVQNGSPKFLAVILDTGNGMAYFPDGDERCGDTVVLSSYPVRYREHK